MSEIDPYSVSIDGFDPNSPFTIAEKMNERAIEEAGAQELHDLVVVSHAAHCAVWNIATTNMRKYGAPTRTAEGPFGMATSFEKVSTGLIELEGMTSRLTEETPAAQITGSRMPDPVVDLRPRKEGDLAQSMLFTAYTVRPFNHEQDFNRLARPRVLEKQLPKSTRHLPGGLLIKMLKLRPYQIDVVGEIMRHPHNDGFFFSKIIRPTLPVGYKGLTDHTRVAKAAANHLRIYNDMNTLYEYIGAMGTPLREKEEFAR